MSDNFCKLDPKTVSRALRVLASEISAPDNVPAMCLCEGARLIEEQDKEIEHLGASVRVLNHAKDAAHSALRAILDNHDKLTAADCADIARGVLGGGE